MVVSQLALLVDGVVAQLFSLDKAMVTIGRSADSDIRIDDSSVSTNHAVIYVSPNELLDGHDDILIEDQQSRNGTLVNDRTVHRCRLQPDDVIGIGFNRFKLLDDRAAGRESTVLMIMD
jgi:pSer/pThr/pTyr-binding forkhead associated (FHA) protein